MAEKDSSYLNSYVTKNELVHSSKPSSLNAIFIDKVLFNEKQGLVNV